MKRIKSLIKSEVRGSKKAISVLIERIVWRWETPRNKCSVYFWHQKSDKHHRVRHQFCWLVNHLMGECGFCTFALLDLCTTVRINFLTRGPCWTTANNGDTAATSKEYLFWDIIRHFCHAFCRRTDTFKFDAVVTIVKSVTAPLFFGH